MQPPAKLCRANHVKKLQRYENCGDCVPWSTQPVHFPADVCLTTGFLNTTEITDGVTISEPPTTSTGFLMGDDFEIQLELLFGQDHSAVDSKDQEVGTVERSISIDEADAAVRAAPLPATPASKEDSIQSQILMNLLWDDVLGFTAQSLDSQGAHDR
jgi:hypothetical protein